MHSSACPGQLPFVHSILQAGAGGQDKTIKQWSGNHAHTTHSGHTDSVRGLCTLPGIGFVSASNDMTLRVWATEGGTLAQLAGHTALVYSCAATASGMIASGAESAPCSLALQKAPQGRPCSHVRHCMRRSSGH